MKGGWLVLYLALFSLGFGIVKGLETCQRKCSAETVPYPFGFSEGCPYMLNCSTNGNITMEGFRVLNITAQVLVIRRSFQCQKLAEYPPFQDKYALTARNVVLAKNCTKFHGRSCGFNVSSLTDHISDETNINTTSCTHLSDYSCFHMDGDFIAWKELNASNCESFLLANMVVDGVGSSEMKVSLGALELGWWIDGNCSVNSCSRNADCRPLESPNSQKPAHTCYCQTGFVGDGYANGDGCRRPDSSVCNSSGRCRKASNVAVVIGGLIGGATAVAVMVLGYCFFRRSCAALEKWRNRKRLLQGNGGLFAVPVFTYRELERATKGFSDKERLGNGAYGTVYAGRLRSDRPVAVKKIRQMDHQGVEQVMNEIKLLSSVDHPNLVRLLGCCLEKGEPILVYEYMPNGTLSQHLQRQRGEGLSWTQRLTLATETAHALAYLHSAINPPIYHRDVKSTNILLDYSFNSKVGDFGLSRIVLTEMSHISTVPQGTPGYVDPQYHQNFHLSDKSDVYSFGVVLVEMITALKVVDFSRKSSEINLAVLATNKIGSGRLEEIIDPFLEAEKDPVMCGSLHRVAELAFRCLAFDRDARPAMVEVAEELDFIRSSYATKHGTSLTPKDVSDNDDSSLRSIKGSQTSSSGSRRIIIPEVKRAIVRQKTEWASPVSVQDPWASGQSSPSTSSLLNNVID